MLTLRWFYVSKGYAQLINVGCTFSLFSFSFLFIPANFDFNNKSIVHGITHILYYNYKKYVICIHEIIDYDSPNVGTKASKTMWCIDDIIAQIGDESSTSNFLNLWGYSQCFENYQKTPTTNG